MLFQCQACDGTVEYDPSPQSGSMPSSWQVHQIKGRGFLLCSSCGNPSHFHGGLSPWLKDRLSAKYGLVFDTNE